LQTGDKEAHGEYLQTILETTCASEIKKVYPPLNKKKCNYWWNAEISTLRKETTRSRRKAQRASARGRSDATHLNEVYKASKRKLVRS
jgi:hypothetical protein